MSDQIATPTTGASAPEQTAPAAAPTTPTEAEVRKFKVKVDGKELEVDEKTLTRDYQKYRSADAKFQQAAELIKHADLTKREKEAEMSELMSDPAKYFKKLGKDPKQWAEELLIEDLKRQSESPEQREARLVREENARLKAEAKAREDRELTEKQKADKERLDLLTSQAVNELDQEIPAAIEAAGLKGVSPRFLAAVADEMLTYLDAKDGRQKLSAKDAVNAVKKRAEAEARALIEKLPVKELREFLSSREAEIRKSFVDTVMDSSPTRRPATTGKASTTTAKPKVQTTEDYFKNLDNKFT